jgi:monovalent cation:H+ antiporter, CPA1 family
VSEMTPTSGIEFLVWPLIVAAIIAMLAKRLRIPYTVSLVLGGLLLGVIQLPILSPLQPGHRPDWLTPDVILILFLPALVFEGSVKLDVRELLRNSVPLLLLANVGVLLAALVTGYLVHTEQGCFAPRWGISSDRNLLIPNNNVWNREFATPSSR